MTDDDSPLPRVSPPRIFPQATRAAKPPLDAAGSADAYRQTTFVLGKDIDLLLRGFELEASIAEASAGAKFRNHRVASALGLWSRTWLTRLAAMHQTEWGNYVAAVASIRAAADYQAACLYVLRDDAREWQEWLSNGGVAINPAAHATEYRLHAFRAAEVLAAHPVLGPIYRASTDLSLSHFGSTLLLVGNDSTPERTLMTFGDRDFHLGLAELTTGWLLQLSAAQLEAAREFSAVFPVPDETAIAAYSAQVTSVVSSPSRCRVESSEIAGEQRYLVHEWRRQPGAAPKRVLL